jgi:transglutaminase-like putative cysteine protease
MCQAMDGFTTVMTLKRLVVLLVLAVLPTLVLADWFSAPPEPVPGAEGKTISKYAQRVGEFKARHYDNLELSIWNPIEDEPEVVGVKVVLDYHLDRDVVYGDVPGGVPMELSLFNPEGDYAKLAFLSEDGSVRREIALEGKHAWANQPTKRVFLNVYYFAPPEAGIAVKAGERLRLTHYWEMPMLPGAREIPSDPLPEIVSRIPKCKVRVSHPWLRDLEVTSPGLVLEKATENGRYYRCDEKGLERFSFRLSSIKEYAEVAAHYRELHRRAVAGTDVEALRKVAAEVVGDSEGLEAVRRLYAYVTNLPYVMRLPYFSFAPLSPEKTLKDGGKCDDKSLLLRELLRTQGVESRAISVSTKVEDLPEPAGTVFDHMLLYVPGFDLYLDTTDYVGGPGLPEKLAGAPMLDSVTGKVGRLPAKAVDKPTERTAGTRPIVLPGGP